MKDLDELAKRVFSELTERNGGKWKSEISMLIRADESDIAKAAIRGIIFYRAQVPDLDCPMGDAVLSGVGTYAAFHIYAPACFDGCAGEGYTTKNADYVCKWAGWDGPTKYQFEVKEIVRSAIDSGRMQIVRVGC